MVRTGQIAFVCDHCGRLTTKNYEKDDAGNINIDTAPHPSGWSTVYDFNADGETLCPDCLELYSKKLSELKKWHDSFVHKE